MPIKNYKIPKKHLTNSALVLAIISLAFWLFDTLSIKQSNVTDYDQTEEGAAKIEEQTIIAVATPVDGDSIKIAKGEYIRLLAIDAPEFKQKCLDKNYQEYNCGEISAQFLNKLVAGKTITCSYQKKDIYNRYLALCYLGQININYEILKNGMAIIYNPLEASEELKNIEKQAKLNKIGVWQGPFLEPKEYRKKNKRKANDNKK